MSKIMIWCAGLALVGAAAGCGQPAAAPGRAGGSWSRAIAMPGLVALDKGGTADVTSVSCASAGNCAAGGTYHVRGGGWQGFVASERNGHWGRATGVSGLAGLNKGGQAGVSSVSCGAAGNCAAGGYYTGRSRGRHAFVVSERNGVWGRAAGLRAPEISLMSCASAGNCSASGGGLVVSEKNGRWGTAIKVPGLGSLGEGGDVTSMSCASAGNCAVGGYYYSDHDQNISQGFVASERNGRWGTAIEVPGLAALNKDNQAEVDSVSCGAAGDCAAAGIYTAHFVSQGFVAVERNGRWGTATEVPGLGALNKVDASQVDSVSCASAGNCAAGGTYHVRGGWQGFVAAERNGVWGTATGLPGLRALNKGGYAEVTSMSCGSPGNCAAGGDYSVNFPHPQGFLATERNGVWGTAIQVPGLAALDKGGNAKVTTVSCAPAGTCAAGGYYTNPSRPGHLHEFVTTERNSP